MSYVTIIFYDERPIAKADLFTMETSTVALKMETAMSDPLLTISNHHAAGCGDPPIIDDRDPDLYVGYFANAFGEQ